MEKLLAKITSAKLEIKERGILNFWIFVDYEDGGSQGIGGLVLDTWDESKKRRIGTSYGCEMIRQLLTTLNVNDFSEMKGKNIYVLSEKTGWNIKPLGIETLKIDGKVRRLIFDEIYQEFKNEI